jgi:5-bromo-4-chloroindolyl phosphate hydrolysis protein
LKDTTQQIRKCLLEQLDVRSREQLTLRGLSRDHPLKFARKKLEDTHEALKRIEVPYLAFSKTNTQN